MSRTDRVIGIALGLLIGVAAVVLFVFLDSSSSIDAPSLDQPAGMEREAAGENAGGREGAAP